jgi:hypothetical protein
LVKTAVARQTPINVNSGKVFSGIPRDTTVEELFVEVFSKRPSDSRIKGLLGEVIYSANAEMLQARSRSYLK